MEGAKRAVTEKAIARIREMIVGGRLGPGDRLPREGDLAAALGLGRSSLREAVRTLTLAGILETRQGAGTYVTSLSPSRLLEPAGQAVPLLPPRARCSCSTCGGCWSRPRPSWRRRA